MTKNNDEIDLIEVFSKSANWFKKVCNSIIMFFIRNFIRLSIFILIGIGIAFANYFSTKRYYNTEMILQTNAVSSADMINYLNTFDIKSFNKNNSNSLKDIKAYYIIDINKDGQPDYVEYKNITDTAVTNRRMKNKVDILISVYKNSSIDSIKDTILSFITKNKYFQKVNNLRINQLNNLISKTNVELQKLDSVESINYFYKNPYEKSNEKNMIILNEKDVKLFHNDILTLYKRKQSYKKQLALYKDIVTVTQDFTPIIKAKNSLTKKLKNFIIILFCIGLVYSIIIDQRKNLKTLIQRSKKK